MVKYAVVFTTYAWDDFIERQYQRIKSKVRSGDLYILADDTGKLTGIDSAYKTFRVNAAMAKDLGLAIKYSKALFWHNLDYMYIIFGHKFPDYDYYIFMDYDAVINVDTDDLIERISANAEDLVAERIKSNVLDWYYTPRHSETYPENIIAARILPIVVLSKAAVKVITAKRQDLTRALQNGSKFYWPFCEAIVSTELAIQGYRCSDLSLYGDVTQYDWAPALYEGELGAQPEGSFIHPVLDQMRFVRFRLQQTPGRQLLKFPSTIPRAVRPVSARLLASILYAEFKRRLARRFKKPTKSNQVQDHEIVYNK